MILWFLKLLLTTKIYGFSSKSNLIDGEEYGEEQKLTISTSKRTPNKNNCKEKKRTYLEKKIMSKIEQTRHGEKQDNEGNAIW